MHRTIGEAIAELRRIRNWSQAELAREISRHGRRGTPAPLEVVISDWERGLHAPAPQYRAALARIARKDKTTEDLAPLFLASMNAWEVVTRVQLLRERQQ
jgi:transcriptional regulator with XRE-family HTH domain